MWLLRLSIPLAGSLSFAAGARVQLRAAPAPFGLEPRLQGGLEHVILFGVDGQGFSHLMPFEAPGARNATREPFMGVAVGAQLGDGVNVKRCQDSEVQWGPDWIVSGGSRDVRLWREDGSDEYAVYKTGQDEGSCLGEFSGGSTAARWLRTFELSNDALWIFRKGDQKERFSSDVRQLFAAEVRLSDLETKLAGGAARDYEMARMELEDIEKYMHMDPARKEELLTERLRVKLATTKEALGDNLINFRSLRPQVAEGFRGNQAFQLKTDLGEDRFMLVAAWDAIMRLCLCDKIPLST